MNDLHITRMFLTTAVLAAVAVLLAVPARAMFADDGGAVTSEPQAAPGSPVPDLSRVDAYASRFDEESSFGLTGDSALSVDRAVARADKAFETYRDNTASAARGALRSASQAAPLPHGIGVDESLSSGQQPSVGLTGDTALTRAVKPASSATKPVSSRDDFDWTWVGFGGGLAALLLAAMGAFYLSTRHRGRIALP